MFTVLHGKNTKVSYLRLKSLVDSFPPDERLKLSSENSLEDLYQALLTDSIVDDKRLIVCENFLTAKKIKPDDKLFLQIPASKTVIFWEADILSDATLKKLPKGTNIEVFKPEPKSFWFLDSLVPNSKISLKKLAELDSQDKSYGLLPSLASRVLLLVCIKSNYDLKTSSQIAGYNLQTWQWEKLKNQSREFTLENLKSFLNGILKADMLLKTGATKLTEESLVSFLLIKYLKV